MSQTKNLDTAFPYQCEGFRRYGGALSFGPPQWLRCAETGTVLLGIDGRTPIPACHECWQECIENGMNIDTVTPIPRGECNE